ncbi:uncharacterized protein LOC106661819 isoform X2 [Cimex lectularius]|uniref:Serendipity locus protein alpha n=1 Tax=Cimex lectularius TaxID=79782 RepID=A0A8I6R9C3_CIMLE|nr:uncharacterized protein LOC106661819 isoform X2 [Cimex lectularius]
MSFPAIEKVLTQLEAMERQVLSDNIYKQVQTLVKILPDAIDEIKRHKKSKEFKPFNNKTKLCASQLNKTLPLLISVVTNNGVNPSFREIMEFLTEKIRWCLLEVLRVFRGSSCDSDREPSGIFVSSMDYAINHIQNDEPIDDRFKNLLDDLLCQSLTIAKLSSNTDYQEIAVSCKNVLVKFSAMRSNKEKLTIKSLKKELLLSSLENLERKVNTAVLRMYLHVMSESCAPIKTFTTKCLGKKLTPRQPSDLNADIIQMDHYCDQIQTIGNFAVACTESFNMKLKVQCCLASLEFIENYFVPTATAFYMDSTSIVKRNFFKFLAEESQKELKTLQGLLDNIVDSSAFAQVVHDDLTTLSQQIKDSILDGIYNKKDAETFLFRCFRLIKHLHTTDDRLVQDDPKIKEASNELEKSLFTLQYKIQVNLFNQPSMQNLVAEIELILFCVNKITQALNITNSFSFSFSSASRGLRNQVMDDNTGSDTNMNSLEPYLIRVAETPRKLTLFAKTPSKFTPCQPKIDKYSSYNVTDRSGWKPNQVRLAEAFGLVKEMNNEDDSLKTSNSENYDTAYRLEDLEFLDNKITDLRVN